MAEIKGNIRNVTQKLTGNIANMGVKGDKGDPGDGRWMTHLQLRVRQPMPRKSGTK